MINHVFQNPPIPIRSSRKSQVIEKTNLAAMMVFLAFMAVVLIIPACSGQRLTIGPVETDLAWIELGDVRSIEAELFMGSGHLHLSGGSPVLLDGHISTNIADWRPEIEYSTSDDGGRLIVRQPAYRESLPLNLGDIQHEWDLRLSSAVPVDLHVTVGAGGGDLNLSGLEIGQFIFEGGAGDMRIDLSDSGAQEMDIALGAGDVTLDLGGDWTGDTRAAIKGGLGRVSVILPSHTGVQVTTKGMLSKINAPQLTGSRGVYTNDVYGIAEAALLIDIESGFGEIVLELDS